jgi:hypothetical protein
MVLYLTTARERRMVSRVYGMDTTAVRPEVKERRDRRYWIGRVRAESTEGRRRGAEKKAKSGQM